MIKILVKPKKIFIKLAILILLTLFSGGLILYEYQRPAYQGGEGKLEHQENEIQVIEVADGKIIRNTKEGFELKVPKEWVVKPRLSKDVTIEVRKSGTEQPTIETDLIDGVNLQISIKANPKNLSIEEWAKKYWSYTSEELNRLIHTTINNIPAIKTIEKIGNIDNGPWKNLTINMSHTTLTNGGKYYDFYCEAIGSDSESQTYIKECEKLIKI